MPVFTLTEMHPVMQWGKTNGHFQIQHSVLVPSSATEMRVHNYKASLFPISKLFPNSNGLMAISLAQLYRSRK